MSRTLLNPGNRPPSLPVSLRRALPILSLALSFCFGAAAGAKEAGKTICCRASGGTRGTCLNVWAHLVPPDNRFNPGKARAIALLQGTSPQPTSMTVQLTTMAGNPVGEQVLEPRGVGIRLLRLPETASPPLNQPLAWESFPTCRPNKPPTRSSLVMETLPEDGRHQKLLAELGKSCGGVVETATLLRQFDLEEFIAKLPAQLPVHCQSLTLQSLGITPSGAAGESRGSAQP
jgi:hypothetical protein